MVGLEVGGAVGDGRVAGGVGLEKAVAGETGHLVPELSRSIPGKAADLSHSRDKVITDGEQLVAMAQVGDAPPQNISFPQAEPRELVGDAQDLLLVEHHAVGASQNRLQAGVEVACGFLPPVAADKRVLQPTAQGSRLVQSQADRDVFEGAGAQLLQCAPHPGRFGLEAADGAGSGEEIAGGGVAIGNRFGV